MEFSLPSLKYSDSLIVVFISICTAFHCEAISWILKKPKQRRKSTDLSKFKSGVVVAVVLFVVFGLLNSLFEGKSVAKLLFTPAALVHKMSHRGILGDDVTDCSMAFLYFLCSISTLVWFGAAMVVVLWWCCG
ncbi:hypothetical protein ACHQM5_009839 [Ranunculus cassubicifolius]